MITKIFFLIVIGIMLLSAAFVIIGIVLIGKWSDEAMDRILKLEEEKRKNQISNFK